VSERYSNKIEIAALLTEAKSLTLLTHDRPDGDGLGSMVALARAARQQGKTARLICHPSVPRQYAFLTAGEQFFSPLQLPQVIEASDRVVVLDTCTWSQLASVAETLSALREKIVVIDHHQTHQDIAAVMWCDASAAAAGVMLAELMEQLHWPIDPPIAEALMTAVCFDTGWLQFANTDSRVLSVVARCIDAGVTADGLYRKLYQNDRPQRLAIMGCAISALQLHCDGQVAVMAVTRDDFAAVGAETDETENLVNEPMRIGSVCVSVLLTEMNDCIRCSLRSRPGGSGEPGLKAIDVAGIAQTFGGGGHTRAAACRLPGPIAEATQKVLVALNDVI